jgi:hypothetical protein
MKREFQDETETLVGFLVFALIAGFCVGLFVDDFNVSQSAFARGRQSIVGFAWEMVPHNAGGRIDRAKVPGGWIVRSGGMSITFVPDANHKWD